MTSSCSGLELAARRELPAGRGHVLRVRGCLEGDGGARLPRRWRVRRAAAERRRRGGGAGLADSARRGTCGISFACSMQTLEKAIERMGRVLDAGRDRSKRRAAPGRLSAKPAQITAAARCFTAYGRVAASLLFGAVADCTRRLLRVSARHALSTAGARCSEKRDWPISRTPADGEAQPSVEAARDAGSSSRTRGVARRRARGAAALQDASSICATARSMRHDPLHDPGCLDRVPGRSSTQIER